MAAGGGGSWKVAYADFTTAMMALFMVLWLTSQDQKLKQAIERSFKHPFHSFENQSSGLLVNDLVDKVKSGKGNFDSTSAIELMMLRQMQQEVIKQLEDRFDQAMEHIELEMTPDGVRLTLFDHPKKPIFEQGLPDFTPYGRWIVENLAWILMPFDGFDSEIEGYSERLDDPTITVDAWKLSAERILKTRSTLILNGLEADHIHQGSIFGDGSPVPGLSPTDPANRRITIQLKKRDLNESLLGRPQPLPL